MRKTREMTLDEAIQRVRELQWAYTGLERTGENVKGFAKALRMVCEAAEQLAMRNEK